MRSLIVRCVVIASGGLWLAGCNTTVDTTGMFEGKRPTANAYAAVPPPSSLLEVTGSIAPRDHAAAQKPEPSKPEHAVPPTATATPTPAPSADNTAMLAKGRAEFRAGNYAEAELSFRRAAELNPRDAEAWLGLAACFDRMRRFELADRAYIQAVTIKGPTSEVLNNQGYSYLLRGDIKRARATLTAARNKDPDNVYVRNNLQLLEQKERSVATATPTPAVVPAKAGTQ